MVTFRCPICDKQIIWGGNPWRPFCSERCRLIDLADWATGRYAIPSEPLKEDSSLGEEEPEERKNDPQ